MSPRSVTTALLSGAVVVVSGGCTSGQPEPKGPAGYRVVYRVDDTSAAAPRVTTVVVDRAGPYVGRIRTREGAPPGGRDLGGTAWDGERQYVLTADRPSSVADVAPGFTGADANLDVSLTAAFEHHLVRRGGTATVAGRPCVVWHSKEPLDAASWAPPTDADHVASCVDDGGLLLREAWTLAGRVVRTRTAVSVGAGPTLSGPALLGGPVPSGLPSTPGPEQVRQVDAPTLAKALGIPLPEPPIGFALDRSAAVLQRGPGGQPSVEGGVLTYLSTDGERLVELRLERGLAGRTLSLPTDGVPVNLRDGRTARLQPGYVGLRASFLGGHGLLATVTADLQEEALLIWAATLELP